MNKYDKLLIFGVLLIIGAMYIYMNSGSDSNNLVALVSYDGKQVLSIDMNTDKKYEVKGYLGPVKIEVNNKRIRVIEETSPNNICSKQGYVSSVTTPIICLPNKITIRLVSNREEYDSII